MIRRTPNNDFPDDPELFWCGKNAGYVHIIDVFADGYAASMEDDDVLMALQVLEDYTRAHGPVSLPITFDPDLPMPDIVIIDTSD